MCVPQRHKFPARAWRIAASVGFGFLSRNALAVIIIPLMQYPHCAACSLRKAS